MKAVLDTNIIIDYLNGDERARNEMSLYKEIWISIITYIEVLVGVRDSEKYDVVKSFLLSLRLIEVDDEVADISIEMRKKHRIKVPDALIMASVEKIGAVLVTRNTNDFDERMPFIRVPYTI